MSTNKLSYKAKIEKLANSQVKVLVTVPAKEFEAMFESAKTKVLSEAKLNGFRDGKVPFGAYVKAYGEFGIRQEMGYEAVDQTYIQVIVGEKIEAIGRPEVAILQVAKDKDFEYQFITDVLPEVELGDYKKYHKEVKLEEIQKATEDEVNDAVEELRRMRMIPASADATAGEAKEMLPELDEKFLKSVGDFKTVEDLKKRIEDNINNEKSWKAEEKRKVEIFSKLVTDSTVEVPNSLVLNELSKLEEKIKADLAQMGVSFEDYLKHMKKTLADWQESEKETAKKQVVLQLALHTISKKENIKVSEVTVNNEVHHLLEHYPDLSRERAVAYTEEKMTNSLVAEYLVTGKVPDEKELFGSHEGHNH
jgi:FKBP-type peptidyl-prolyl cis-trans isomerase (trigger factor)